MATPDKVRNVIGECAVRIQIHSCHNSVQVVVIHEDERFVCPFVVVSMNANTPCHDRSQVRVQRPHHESDCVSFEPVRWINAPLPDVFCQCLTSGFRSLLFTGASMCCVLRCCAKGFAAKAGSYILPMVEC